MGPAAENGQINDSGGVPKGAVEQFKHTGEVFSPTAPWLAVKTPCRQRKSPCPRDKAPDCKAGLLACERENPNGIWQNLAGEIEMPDCGTENLDRPGQYLACGADI